MAQPSNFKVALEQAGEQVGFHGMGVDDINTWSISPRPAPDGSVGVGKDGKISSQVDKSLKKNGEEVNKSLGLKQDTRFVQIKGYRDAGQAGKHFASIVATEDTGKQARCTPSETTTPDPSSLAGRIAWQDSFDSTINRLMVDFSLSDEPECRLNHLDRLYKWFNLHGAKQARKATISPSFLSLEKNAPAPLGSTRNVTAPLSQTSLVLSNSMAMRRSRRMPPAQNILKPATSQKDSSSRKYKP